MSDETENQPSDESPPPEEKQPSAESPAPEAAAPDAPAPDASAPDAPAPETGRRSRPERPKRERKPPTPRPRKRPAVPEPTVDAEGEPITKPGGAKIAFIGGTGPEGMGLAMRFAKSGNAVFIGSRTEERAAEAVAQVQAAVPEGEIYGGFNTEGAEKADFVFITVPADAHRDTLLGLEEAIGEKIVVDVVVPMLFDKDGPRALAVDEGSTAQEAQAILPKAKVVSGFHHLDAGQLQRVDKPMQGDVIVCSDHKSAKRRVMNLAEEIHYIRGLDGGPLSNSKYAEQMTVLLLHINRIYKAHTGVRITGV